VTVRAQETKKGGAGGVVFVGFLLTGLAVGILLGNLVAGLLGGLGVGFVAMGIVHAVTGRW
jgi:hypothetical protein